MSDLFTCYMFQRLNNGRNASLALAAARLDVAQNRTRHPSAVEAWNPATNGARFVDNLAAAGLRLVGHADEIARLGHKGYYTSEFQDETIRGVVVQLPGKGRRARYMAGYETATTDGFVIDCTEIFEGSGGDRYDEVKRDVARAADDFAEREASRERNYQAAWQAGLRYSGLLDEAKQARNERRKLARDLRAAKATIKAAVPESICATLRQRMADLLAQAKRATDDAAELLEGAISNVDAFNEGAGMEVIK